MDPVYKGFRKHPSDLFGGGVYILTSQTSLQRDILGSGVVFWRGFHQTSHANMLARRTAKRFFGVILELKPIINLWPSGYSFSPFTSISSSQISLPSYFDPRISFKLLSSYLKLGEIDNADKLFDEIPHRDIFTWSIMIHGYAKNGLFKGSLKLFSSMRVSGLTPNSFTVVGVLGGIVGLHDLVLAESIHGFVLKAGLESNSIVVTALLDTYAKCGSISVCYELFKQMDSPSVVSCNAMLAGLVYNQLFEEAVKMFIQFRQYGLLPSSSTALSLIQGCIASNSWALCESVHALAFQLGLVKDVHVSNSILNMYSSLRNLDAAEMAFTDIKCKDVASYSTMIGLFNELEIASGSIQLFHEMKLSGIKYDLVTIMNLISACTILGNLRSGKEIHAHAIVCGFGSELTFLNSIIAMYAKCGDPCRSRAIFNRMKIRSSVSWTAIISGLVNSGNPQEAVEFLNRFRKEEFFCSFDLAILVSALKASGQLVLMELCQQLHTFTIRIGFVRYASVTSSLISAYSKCGNVEHAERVFQEMDAIIRNVVSWNAIISGLGMNGHGRTALLFFNDMLKSGEEPDSATYLCVLAACSHGGLVEEGLGIIEQMVKENRATEEHFWCVVDLVSRSGWVSDMNGFLSSSVEEMMGGNAWKALLSGCLLHGNTDLAEYASKRIRSMDEEDEAGEAVLVSNVLASAGRFEDSEARRSSINGKRLVKNPGISYVGKTICTDFCYEVC